MDNFIPQISVIGLGGGGGNAVLHMLKNSDESTIQYRAANTDLQALQHFPPEVALPLGQSLTNGLGAGANPQIGYQAAIESEADLRRCIGDTELLVITAGMGGGTGTGAAPALAQMAKKAGILTVAIVTRPFSFEGRKRQLVANEGIEQLAEQVDSLIIIPNDRLMAVLGSHTSMLDAFAACNDVLRYGVNGISDMIVSPGMINVDFADVRAVLSIKGFAKIGLGMARGEGRAKEATEAAIHSPLLEQADIRGAQGVLVNITAGPDLTIGEFNEIGEIVRQYLGDNATVVIGSTLDMSASDTINVSIVASGVAGQQKPSTQPTQANPISTTPANPQTKRGKRTEPVPAVAENELLDIPTFLRRSIN